MRVETTAEGILITTRSPADQFRLEKILAQTIRSHQKAPREAAQIPDEHRLKAVVIGQWSMAEIEKAAVLDTLDFFEGNKRRASEALGISLKTLYNKLNLYGIWRDS